jgi:hypothetical protein
MGIKFTNNAEGELAAGISDSATSLTLTAGDGSLFPAAGGGDYFYATLISAAGVREVIKVTAHTGGTDVFTTIIRGQDDSDPAAFSTSDKCELRFPKIILEEFRDDIAANLAAIGTNDTDIAALQARDTADEQVLYAPTGLTMYIYNPAAEIPTGWSAKSGPADCLLAIAGGGQAYDVAGENLAGSWTPTGHKHTGPSHTHTGPSHTHTGPSHAHTTPSHALSIAEMPAHTHTIGLTINRSSTVAGSLMPSNQATGMSTGSAGSGSAHAHGNTGAGGTGATGAGGTGATGSDGTGNTSTVGAPSTDRPYAAIGLLIERD